ncbi:hypothetical protein DWF00_08895 [Bosea caraganae]|uniref:Uncharacterized protein n=1 Tax=Bosea caraganae TaxID=2763117 RepID=A0A370LB67_9HYPH|nr:hypothetical protein [Bosea caraganae]RDJ27111.1 hypothetical protein DWF00_08895 [Bosea caraganae]RDJ29128.1 hypothetical protein DWE98_00670 [Bosea caraganae]
MTYVLNAPAGLAAKPANLKGLTFWQRVYAAMIESRRRAAIRELRAYSYLIKEAELVLGDAQDKTASLPFNR